MLEHSLADVHRKFEGTVCSFRNLITNKDEVGYVHGIGGKPDALNALVLEGNENKKVFLEFHYRRPRCGWLPVSWGSICLKRYMTGKNWQIGLSGNNTRIIGMGIEGVNKMWYQHLTDVQDDVFNPRYDLLPDRRHNALSRLFTWDQETGDIHGIQGDIIAKLSPDLVVTKIKPEYKQELTDIIKRRNLPWLIS